MTLNPRQRWLILGSLLAATIGAGLWLEDEAPETAPAPRERRAPKPGPEASAATTQTALALAKPDVAEKAEQDEAAEDTDKDDAESLIDPFRPATWYVPPPPPPPAKPRAPGLPFRYLGRLVEDGSARVFLGEQDRHLIVKAGEVINGTYKVDKISDGQIVFVYLPLKERQVLPTGGD